MIPRRWASPVVSLFVIAAACVPDLPVATPQQPNLTAGVKVLRRVEHPYSFALTRPATDGTLLFADNGNGGIVAIDRASGEQRWALAATDGQYGYPVVLGSRVLAAGKRAHAIDAATGTILWTVELNLQATGHTTAALDGRFFFGTDSTVYALDVADGQQLWRTGIGDGWAYVGRVRGVAARGNAVYVCAQEPLEANGWRSRGNVLALDAATGTILWRYLMEFETQFNFCFTEPLVTEQHVVLADLGGNNIVALDRATGAFQWRYQGESGWVGPYEPPTQLGSTMLIAPSNDRHVTALNAATGQELWRTRTESSTRSATVCGSVVLASDFRLSVLDAGTGQPLARNIESTWNANDAIYSRFLVEGDTAFVFGRQVMLKLECPRH